MSERVSERKNEQNSENKEQNRENKEKQKKSKTKASTSSELEENSSSEVPEGSAPASERSSSPSPRLKPGTCAFFVHSLATENPYVLHLLEQIRRYNGLEVDILCQVCDKPTEGYFDGSNVVVCENFVKHAKRIEKTVRHELVHAFDLARTNFDTSNCAHIACTEIRASNLSSECAMLTELQKFKNIFQPKHLEDCVKRRVSLSLQNHDHCKDKIQELIDLNWKPCFYDWEPFDFPPQ